MNVMMPVRVVVEIYRALYASQALIRLAVAPDKVVSKSSSASLKIVVGCHER